MDLLKETQMNPDRRGTTKETRKIFKVYAKYKTNATMPLEFQLYECQMYQVTLKGGKKLDSYSGC